MKDKSLDILREYFGYTSFKAGQKAIIDKIYNKQDVLGIMPTGAGKSICFQIPALMFEGTALVISPLISLMKDQVDTLNEMGIKAAFINSSLAYEEYRYIMSNAQRGEYKLLYIAPERLENESFNELLTSLEVSLLAVDEAHCVSEWGHDFRPSYMKIAHMISRLPKRPIVAAFTATATSQVRNDIERLLKLQKPFTLVTGFDRENLYFEVAKPNDKFDFALNYIMQKKDEAGIIYCATRKVVEGVCEKLNKHGIAATRYHAGLTDNERRSNQEAFINDKVQVMTATNAFGMGIDKSNIRYVIHYNMPKSLENYYQEAGRAGRDGEKADCILLYSAADIVTNKLLIENNSGDADKAVDYSKLQDMTDYCNTDGCLRAYILKYFGEKDVEEACDNCINCLSDIESTNITIEAQKILSCIKRTNERFGSGVITDVLRGSNSQKLKQLGFDRLSTFGVMKEYSKETIKEIIAYLIAEGFIDIAGDKYPILALNSKSYSLLRNETEISIKRVIVKSQSKAKVEELKIDKNLYERLKALRREIADEQNMPPFIVFSDATLNDMCRKYPTNNESMLNVSGVGKHKLDKYGDRFIEAVREYVEENKIEIAEAAATSTMNMEKKEKNQKSDKSKKAKADTNLVTYELYISGKTIEEICKERGLTQITIEGHLIECLERGLDLEYECFLPKEYEDEIFEAIEACGTERLKPIKEALSSDITYTMIKFALWKYKAEGNIDRAKQ